MATPTYIALATTTLSSAASGVTFTSIPSSYRDLVLVFTGTTSSGFRVQLNNDTGSNYTTTAMGGSGSGTGAVTEAAAFAQPTYWANFTTLGSMIIHFQDYSVTDKHTTFLARANGSWVVASANRWANTAAVHTINIQDASANVGAGSTFSLYGIEA